MTFKFKLVADVDGKEKNFLFLIVKIRQIFFNFVSFKIKFHKFRLVKEMHFDT